MSVTTQRQLPGHADTEHLLTTSTVCLSPAWVQQGHTGAGGLSIL